MVCDYCGGSVENGKCTHCGKLFTEDTMKKISISQQTQEPNHDSKNENSKISDEYGGIPPQAPPNPHPKRKIYTTTSFCIFMMIFFFPVGLYLMWNYRKFTFNIRVLITSLFVVGLFAYFLYY